MNKQLKIALLKSTTIKLLAIPTGAGLLFLTFLILGSVCNFLFIHLENISVLKMTGIGVVITAFGIIGAISITLIYRAVSDEFELKANDIEKELVEEIKKK